MESTSERFTWLCVLNLDQINTKKSHTYLIQYIIFFIKLLQITTQDWKC